ncbi:helix-turn-helix domain-containing protein [Paenibacillus sp. HB172176]|uniref:helix-turn-helix domain-containing protein n=1 Tax=Paenibacillus sp. HB172176 TaxID=2493690 RepID=UPI00143B2529|nr:helix-turn-helix domain-containing protein [Paenibacillus sp. HB172176]
MIELKELVKEQGMNWFEDTVESAPFAQFIIVTYGKCLYWIGGKKLLADKGDFLYIPRGASYYGKSVPTVFHEKFIFSFAPSPILYADMPYWGGKEVVHAKAGCYDYCLERLRGVWEEWEEQPDYFEIRTLSFLLEAFSLWGRELNRGAEADISLQHVEKMKAYIQANYRQRITKECLGDCIGRSPNHAAAVFRRITGQTISDYTHAVRIKTGVYMLKESLLTVAEIAQYLGYSDVSYFQRVFKRSLGFPPSQYLKNRPLPL